MVTINNIDKFNNTIELIGLSTNTKPVDYFEYKSVNYKITNGSTYYEMDTKKAFLYDEENDLWLAQ